MLKRLLFGAAIVLIPLQAYAIEGEYHKAQKLGKPATKFMGCPSGSFWDPRNGGECWSCEDGERSVERVDGPRACIVAPKSSVARAKRNASNKTRCARGAFFDLSTAGCWTCPANSEHTALPIRTAKTCQRRIDKQEAKAIYSHEVRTIAHSCGKGHFANAGSRKCYECKSGWKHDPTKRVGKKGVCYKPARTVPLAATLVSKPSLDCNKGFYDPIDGGSCWTCPSGYERSATSVKDAEACIRLSAPELTAARFVKAHAPSTIEIAKGVNELGCRGYGKGAFLDLKGGASCWSCPTSHPRRTLFAVDDRNACASKTCGREGGRPCLVWERIPSCDKGLVEDFVHNQCRKPTNLACKTFVQTVATLKRAVDEANAKGEELSERALALVPGQKQLMQALGRKAQEFQSEVSKVTEKIPVDDVLEPMAEFLAQNQDMAKIVVNMARHAQSTRRDLENVLLDADLVCAGNTDRLAYKLESLGFASLARPSRRTGINMATTQQLASAWPFAAATGPMVPLLASDDGLLKHHRIAFDIGVSLPAEKLFGSFKKFNAPLTLGIQFSTNFNGDLDVYFMHGLGAGLSAESNFEHANLLSEVVGATSLVVGFVNGGPMPGACTDNSYSWGVPFKLTDWVGVGLRPNCRAALWGGFGLTIPKVKKGMNEVFSIISPAGSMAAPKPSEYRMDWPEIRSFGVGYEGALKLSGEREGKPGGIF